MKRILAAALAAVFCSALITPLLLAGDEAVAPGATSYTFARGTLTR